MWLSRCVRLSLHHTNINWSHSPVPNKGSRKANLFLHFQNISKRPAEEPVRDQANNSLYGNILHRNLILYSPMNQTNKRTKATKPITRKASPPYNRYAYVSIFCTYKLTSSYSASIASSLLLVLDFILSSCCWASDIHVCSALSKAE